MEQTRKIRTQVGSSREGAESRSGSGSGSQKSATKNRSKHCTSRKLDWLFKKRLFSM